MTDEDQKKIQAIADVFVDVPNRRHALWAELGFDPSDDWQWCDCCGRAVHVDDWKGDGVDCDECAGEA